MVEALLGYAFTLGVLAAINPCGFALLPVYVAQFAAAEDIAVSTPRRVLRAAGSSAVVAAGFVAVFGGIGAVLMAGTAIFMRWVPWAMIVVAALLVLAGVARLTGRWSLRLPQVAARGSGRSWRAMFWFGVAYAVASLSCALPVFLAGVAGAFLQGRALAGFLDFLAYALGMGVLLTGVSVAVTLGKATRLLRLRRAGRWVAPVSSLLLIVTGAYLLYYWITYLALPGTALPGTAVVERVQADVAGWLEGAGVWVGVAIVGAVATILLMSWLRRHIGTANAVLSSLVLPGLLVPAGLLADSTTTHHTATSTSIASPLGVGPAIQRLTSLTPLRPPRLAPQVRLTDQHGTPVSLRQFRGKAVVLAFMDSDSADTSLLFARDLRAAEQRLGPTNGRVEFVGINVNTRHNRVADVARFTRRHGLAGMKNWHFLTGPGPELRRVQRAYGVYVAQRGDAVSFNEVLFFLGPRGLRRAGGMYGGSSQATDRWGQALATISRSLLGMPARAPGFAQPRPGELSGVTVAGHGAAPDVTAPRLFRPGRRLSLADLRGKPVVINFWASWCPPCRREMPALQEAAAKYHGRVAFVGIDIDDSAAAARSAARDSGLTYTLLKDARGAAASAFKVVNLPTTVFIASDGTITRRHTGAISRPDLDRTLRQLSRAVPP